jgi:hypothetical protein
MKRFFLLLGILCLVNILSSQPYYTISQPDGNERLMIFGKLGGNYTTTPRMLWDNYYSKRIDELNLGGGGGGVGIIDSLPNGRIEVDGNGNVLNFYNTEFKASVGNARVAEISLNTNRGGGWLRLQSYDTTSANPELYGLQFSGTGASFLEYRTGTNKKGLVYSMSATQSYKRDSFINFEDVSIPPLGLVKDLISDSLAGASGDWLATVLPNEDVSVSGANNLLRIEDADVELQSDNGTGLFSNVLDLRTGGQGLSNISGLALYSTVNNTAWQGFFTTSSGSAFAGNSIADPQTTSPLILSGIQFGSLTIIEDIFAAGSGNKRGLEYDYGGVYRRDSFVDFSDNSITPLGLVKDFISDSIQVNLNYPNQDGLIAVFDSVNRRLDYVSGGIFGNDTLVFSSEFLGIGNMAEEIEFNDIGALDDWVLAYNSVSGDYEPSEQLNGIISALPLGDVSIDPVGNTLTILEDGSGTNDIMILGSTLGQGSSGTINQMVLRGASFSADESLTLGSRGSITGTAALNLISGNNTINLQPNGSMNLTNSNVGNFINFIAPQFAFTDSDGSEGIRLLGFGEDGSGNGGDYSSLLNNSLVTKGYVDNAITASGNVNTSIPDSLPNGDLTIASTNVLRYNFDLFGGFRVTTTDGVDLNILNDNMTLQAIDLVFNANTYLRPLSIAPDNAILNRDSATGRIDLTPIDQLISVPNIESIPNNLPLGNIITNAGNNQLVITNLSNLTFSFATSDFTASENQLQLTFPNVEFNVPGFEDAVDTVLMAVNPTNDRIIPIDMNGIGKDFVESNGTIDFAGDQIINLDVAIPTDPTKIIVYYSDSDIWGSYVLTAPVHYSVLNSTQIQINSTNMFVTNVGDRLKVKFLD